MNYHNWILSNLEDLLGPETLINPRINLACVYSEIESVVSTLLPRWLDIDGALPDRDVQEAVHKLSCDCDCRDQMLHLGESVKRALADSSAPVGIEQLRSAVAAAERFVTRLASLSYRAHCRCGAGMDYHLADSLSLVPPATCRLTCPACGHHTTWHLPTPSR